MARKKSPVKSSSKSTKKVKKSKKDSFSSLEMFYQMLADLRTTQQVEVFCKDFFTDSEKVTFSKRLAVAIDLHAGLSYEVIRKKYGVSSATISNIAEQLSTAGFQLAIEKVQNEWWAEKYANQIISWFGIKEI